MKAKQRLFLGAVCLVGLGHSAPARAAPAPTEAAEAPMEHDAIAVAKVKVAEGQALYEQAKYDEALAAFQDAAAAYASPDFQFNIGLCYERMGEPAAAIRAFETYLRNKPDASDRAGVEHRIAQLRAEIQLAQAPPAAEATPVQPAPAVPSPRVDATTDVPAPSVPLPHRPLIITGATLLGVGAVVGIGGAIAFGLPAANRTSRIDDALVGGNPQGLTMTQAQDVASQGDMFRGLQIGAVATGVAAVAVGAALVAVGVRRKRSASTRVSVATWFPTVRGRF